MLTREQVEAYALIIKSAMTYEGQKQPVDLWLATDAAMRDALAHYTSCHCCGQPIIDHAAFVKCPACDTTDCEKLAKSQARIATLEAALAGQTERAHIILNHFHDVCNDKRTLLDRVATLEAAYNELIYAVGRKFPGETRHQTALKYIQRAEQITTGPAQAALKPGGA
jgi:uncharacterized Zn finger protein (UPF0148 family)